MGKIFLEGIELFAYHGCYKEEQIIGTRFSVDLLVETDTTKAEEGDHLHDTVSYVHLYQLVKKEMEQKSHLLEHVAKRIMDSIRDQFPQITSIELKINKLNPPVGGKMKQVGFQAYWRKSGT
jgi:dihydroneopterin aldolase